VGEVVGYDERLRVPVWWWPIGAMIAGVLAVEVHLFDRNLPPWVGPAAAGVLVAAALVALGRVRILVRDGQLLVADAKLPLRYVCEVAPLDPAGKRALLGPRADPAAFVVQRAWAPGAVYLRLDDPDDRTPYWLVSTRHPVELARALVANRSDHH
jgi:Protein of unknown function (DUF3093)